MEIFVLSFQDQMNIHALRNTVTNRDTGTLRKSLAQKVTRVEPTDDLI